MKCCSIWSGSGEERLNYLVGQRAVLRLEEGQTQAVFSLTTPDGTEAIPLTADQANRPVSAPSDRRAGNYRVRAGGTVGGVDRGFSANIPSGGDRVGAHQARSFGSAARGRPIPAGSWPRGDRSQRERRARGRELYPYLICLVALALGLEYVLANRFYRWKEQPNLRRPLDAAERRCSRGLPLQLRSAPPRPRRKSTAAGPAGDCGAARRGPLKLRSGTF